MQSVECLAVCVVLTNTNNRSLIRASIDRKPFKSVVVLFSYFETNFLIIYLAAVMSFYPVTYITLV